MKLLVGNAVVAAALLAGACAHPRLREPTDIPTPPSPRAAFDSLHAHGTSSVVIPLDDRAAAWAARWRALDGAQHTVDASYFILNRDAFGLAFLGHLYERARAGVQVDLLLDGRGSAAYALPFLGLDELQELVATGNAEVRIYNPPLTQVAQSLAELSAVPVSAGVHEKILVVDDHLAIVGGRNLASIYFARHDENPEAVEDSDVLIEGEDAVAPLVAAVHHAHTRAAQDAVRRDTINFDKRGPFLLMMYRAMDAWLRGAVPEQPEALAVAGLELAAVAGAPSTPSLRDREKLRPFLVELARDRSVHGALRLAVPAPQAAEVRVIASKSRAEKNDESANDAVLKAVGSAQRRIWLESPYFMMTPRMMAALQTAAARGVEIVVVTNSPMASDNSASQALFIDTWPELEARIPTLRVFTTAKWMIHTKRIIVDDDLTLVGSHNFDPLSAHLNGEVVVAIWSRAMNAAAAARVTGLLSGGDVYEYRIARAPDGTALRDADGKPVVLFGPRNHVPRKKIEELENLKHLLFSVRNIFDFEFVVW